MSKILSIIGRIKELPEKICEEKQNRFIFTSSTVLDAIKVSDLEEVSDQDTDSDVIEWGKVLYIAKMHSNLLVNGE